VRWNFTPSSPLAVTLVALARDRNNPVRIENLNPGVMVMKLAEDRV
jgi:hypothetical protein